MAAPNYCTKAQAAGIANLSEAVILDDWLDWVDALIEQWTGQGYKGAERTDITIGDGGELIVLPSTAAQIQSVTENNRVLSPSTYDFDSPGRAIARRNPYTGYMSQWYPGLKYRVVYIEPDTPPKVWTETAAYCVALCAMFAVKFEDFGIALSASDAGSAGKVSKADSTSFPASLIEEVERAIKQNIRKPGV